MGKYYDGTKLLSLKDINGKVYYLKPNGVMAVTKLSQ